MRLLFQLLALFFISNHALAQTTADSVAILKIFDSWNQGWAEKDVTLAIKDYSEDVDFTNAFGDRFQGKESLKKGLEFIFSLPFVMAGNSSNSEFTDITFLSSDIALVRSKLIRTGQQTSKGKIMPDRHINHLRVIKLIDGEWKIVSHLISDANPKGI